jgi:MYXO-CTERM domain-containing protein
MDASGSTVDGGRRRMETSGGCGCSVPRSSGTLPAGLALAMLAWLAALRRRR